MEEQMIPEIPQASQERIGKFKYTCENCGWKGDEYKYELRDILMMNPSFYYFSGTKPLRTCPQCGKRTIQINPLDNVEFPGHLPSKKWTTRSIIVLILVVVFVLIILPTLSSIYLK